MWDVDADPVNPDDAIAWFRSRVTMTPDELRALSARAQRKAFTVAGVADLDLLHDTYQAIDRAIAEGTTLTEFKRSVGEQLEKRWGGEDSVRLETIFRTNVQSAYSAGRWRQLTDPDVLAERPVWMFDAVLDGRVSPLCKSLDGTTLIAAHPFWETHTPPLHFNCRSGILALSTDEAAERGLTETPPKAQASSGFGLTPVSGEWTPDLGKYPQELVDVYEAVQEPASGLADVSRSAELDAFDGTLDTISRNHIGKDKVEAALKVEIYAEIFADDRLHQETLELVYDWTRHYSEDSVQELMRENWEALTRSEWPSTALGQRILDIFASRAARWERLAAKLEIPKPESFVAYRALNGEEFVLAAARAWKAGKEELVMPHHTLASWSLRQSGAEKFAQSSGSVIYRGEIPFENTLADKLVDDGYFVAGYPDEVEVIVATAEPDILAVSTRELVIHYEQETYSFAERADLIRVLEEAYDEL